MKIVTGYPGGNEVGLAMERGEVQGRCGWSWSSVKSTHQRWFDEKKFTILVQLALDKHPDLPDVPLIIDLAKTDEQRQILRLIFARQAMGRPFVGAARHAAGPRRGAARGVHGDDEGQGLPRRRRQGADGDHAGGRRGGAGAGEGNLRNAARGRAEGDVDAALERAQHFWTNRNPHGRESQELHRLAVRRHRRLIKRYDFPYITLNPGASFRGLHNSLVNYGDNEPPMMLCNHEEIAVQIAHGYAKATGKPMVVILHNLVGLLHACMAIYYAYLDRVPIFIIGATGPMDESKRRPHIDWTHTALVQGNAVRDYVKWDYQPTSIDGVPESFARAYSIMMTEPKGPIYMCYDAALQEAPKTDEVPLPPASAVARAVADGARSRARSRRSPTSCSKAEHPMLLPEYAGRRAGGFDSIVELAELTGSAVWDVNNALNFPNKHPLCLSMDKPSLKNTDLDRRPRREGLGKAAHRAQQRACASASCCRRRTATMSRSALPRSASANGRWTIAACSPARCARSATPRIGIPELIRICKERIGSNSNLQKKIADRKVAIGKRHDEVWAKWQEDASKNWDASPLTFSRLAMEVWDVIKDEDWVLTANELKHQVRKLWDFDKPYRHPGVELGTSTQIGISLGVALAHRDKKRIVVNIQPDGDLMFDAGALWIAAKYKIPMLIVMHNNRAYYNDWAHQIRMAKLRGTDEAKAHIGMDLFGPEPDFAALARSMGCYGEGPIDKPQDVKPALLRALAEVKKGRLALVDTITQHS